MPREILPVDSEDSPGVSVASFSASPPPVAASDEAPESLFGLMRIAIEQGRDVDVLERLVALQERVTERQARAAFIEAKSRFQEQVPEIRRSKTAEIVTQKGARFSYTYAPLEEITRTIRPALRANGLSYSWDVKKRPGALVVTCVLRHVEGHEERSSFPVPVDTSARMSVAQQHGAALTYGSRQSLIAVLGLTTADEDRDGADGRHGSAERISKSQAADLSALIDEVGVNRNKFLAWLNVEDVADVPLHRYRQAVAELESRR